VTDLTFREASVTLSLVAVASSIGLLVGVPLGFLWRRRPTSVRLFARSYVYLALALWAPWVGFVLSYWFAYRWSATPIAGYCNFFGAAPGSDCGGPVQWAYHLLLPGIALGLAVTAYYTVVTRQLLRRISFTAAGTTGSANETLRIARRRAQTTFGKLVLRTKCWLIGGTFLIESIFNLPGLGKGMVTAVMRGDGREAEAILLCATIVALGLYLVVDLVAAAFLPEWRERVP
jgi:peptide/nickel transport system permease protein